MKIDLGQKIGISLGAIVLLFILTDTLITNKVELKNSSVVHGHFKRIEKFKLKTKVSVSYNITTEESSTTYKIIPENISCFDLKLFSQNVKQGQAIDIYINNDKGLRSSTLQNVIGIVVNNHEYIDRNCINKEIKSNKIEISLLILSFSLILILAYFFHKRRNAA